MTGPPRMLSCDKVRPGAPRRQVEASKTLAFHGWVADSGVAMIGWHEGSDCVAADDFGISLKPTLENDSTAARFGVTTNN
jgi:hypothetical protein